MGENWRPQGRGRERDAKILKEALQQTPRSDRRVPGARAGGVKARVAPGALAGLCLRRRSARKEAAQWLRDNELTKRTVASEVTALAAVLGIMIVSGDSTI